MNTRLTVSAGDETDMHADYEEDGKGIYDYADVLADEICKHLLALAHEERAPRMTHMTRQEVTEVIMDHASALRRQDPSTLVCVRTVARSAAIALPIGPGRYTIPILCDWLHVTTDRYGTTWFAYLSPIMRNVRADGGRSDTVVSVMGSDGRIVVQSSTNNPLATPDRDGPTPALG